MKLNQKAHQVYPYKNQISHGTSYSNFSNLPVFTPIKKASVIQFIKHINRT